MGKGSRKREFRQKQLKMLRRERERKLEDRRRLIKSIVVSGVVVVAIAVLIAGAILINDAILDSGILLRNKVAISSEHYQVDNAMVSYFLNATYKSYSNYYGASLSYYLDPDKPLKSQYYDNSTTWFDYFLSAAENTVNDLLVSAEGAHEASIELTEQEHQAIDTYLSNRDESMFGRGVKTDDVRKCLELMTLAYKFENSVVNDAMPTVEEIEKYYTENEDDFLLVDYVYYAIRYDDDNDSRFDSDEAEEFAKELASVGTVKEFEVWIRDFVDEYPAFVYEDDPDKAVENAHMEKIPLNEDMELLKWAFDEATEVGDTYFYNDKDEEEYIIALLVKAPYRDEEVTKSVRHILISADTAGSDEAASLLAAEVLSGWENGKADEESFGLLALAYSEDTGSSMNSGLYQNFALGAMTEEFEEWSFDETREVGDTGIVKTNFGYHIMYFCGDGLLKYQADIVDIITQEALADRIDELSEKYSVTVDSDALQDIYE